VTNLTKADFYWLR